jgi:2-polyprenyl-3-methyl-5-hydroxy-6-metoxy-1,4-benzoquinol methylase
MERAAWLQEKRHLTEVRYDTLFAQDYDRDYGVVDATHRIFMEKLLELCPIAASILDAACGTGKYWKMILACGYSVFGIDQSQQMLSIAHEKFPEVPISKQTLQEMSFTEEFDAVICIDVMELICPEDWTLVLRNIYTALKPGCNLYFTVESIDEKELQQVFIRERRRGLPLMPGEYTRGGGYHYYPSLDQVRNWLHMTPFAIIAESGGDGYYHFLVQKA